MSKEILKPILRGRDIKRYNAEWAGFWIINTIPALKIKIENYPAVKNYLLSFGEDRLEQAGRKNSRKKTPHKWFELQDTCAYHALLEQEKIAWPDITSCPNFSLARKGVYIEATAFMIGSGNKYLLAILNSKLVGYYISSIATDLGGRAVRYKKIFIEKLPIPQIEGQEKIELESLATKRLLEHSNCDTEAIESKINNLVYRLYGLTDSELKIIESFQ